ncbi:MAG: SH3 domain-containing protein [Candidatus Zapsychrus exili]|nr:SH3 domain-containing protein [Candidatus Zapsychrus exili]
MANKVNVRAGASINSSIIGSLNINDKVYILESQEKWYKIEPIDNSYGWITEDYLVFKTNDTTKYQQRALIGKIEELEKKVLLREQNQEKARLRVIEEEKARQEELNRIIKIKGVLELRDQSDADNIKHQVITDLGEVYYLEGPEHIFRDFISSVVEAQGKINHNKKNQHSYPVLIISSIKLVL